MCVVAPGMEGSGAARDGDRYFGAVRRGPWAHGPHGAAPRRSALMTALPRPALDASDLVPPRAVPPIERSFPRERRTLLLAVMVAQLADLATFLPAIALTGIQAESNPLARQLYLVAGDAGPIAFKAIAVVALVLLVRRVAVRFPRLAVPTAAVVIAIGLLGTASNIVGGLLG